MDNIFLKNQHYKCKNNIMIDNHICRCWLKFNGYLPYYNNEFIYKKYKNKIYCLDCYHVLTNDTSTPMEID